MKIFTKTSMAMLTIVFTSGLVGPVVANAATTPSLGFAGTFGILSSTFTANIAVTAITGDLGYTTLSNGTGVNYTVSGGTDYGSGAPYSTAGTDQGSALSALDAQPCTHTFPAGAVDLATDTSHGQIGVYNPGVYCTATGAAASIGTGGITLNGAGTHIFRIDGAFTSVNGSIVSLVNGASSCDVFWTATSATTLGANTTFMGTVIDDSGITVGNTTSWNGRALSFGGTVTTDTNTIDTACATSRATGGSPTLAPGTINVVKLVINDSGGLKKVADFPLFVNGTPVVSGETNTFALTGGVYSITETPNSNYVTTFSGDCDPNGQMNLYAGSNKFCIVTNNDIGAPAVPPVPPLIDLVKVPSPLALPAGPGAVTYTYTLRNVGTVPVTDITLVGDSCKPVSLISGDTNSNSRLEVSETWVYRCTTTLTETHTNTVVATGWANGISATDIASATVVVGSANVAPLIHITKTPNPLALNANGGLVTYTKKVTNPGTVALSNVQVTDDKCSPITRISGDTNNDLKLDPTETWTYVCTANLTETTTNTAVVAGQANGMTARDFAIATVVVASPGLPRTGYEDAAVKKIARSLFKGNRSSDVAILQKFLVAQNKGSAAQALAVEAPTTYFGELTRAALAEFQAAVGVTPSVGNFGSKTRAYISANY